MDDKNMLNDLKRLLNKNNGVTEIIFILKNETKVRTFGCWDRFIF